MFGNWLNGIDKRTIVRIRIGVAVFLWVIWNCRNDVVFNKVNGTHFLHVINRVVYWIHMWSFLLPVDQRGHMDSGYTHLMAVIQAIFGRDGWQHNRRLDA